MLPDMPFVELKFLTFIKLKESLISHAKSADSEGEKTNAVGAAHAHHSLAPLAQTGNWTFASLGG